MAVRFGVIGCGGIADRRTMPEGIMACPDAELVALQDLDWDAAKRCWGKYNATAYETTDEVLGNPGVDAVYIATPTHLHHGQVMAAAKAGKHILCEKPLALTLEECEEMVEECAARGVKLGINFMMRYHACHAALKQMVDAGDLGTLVMGRAELTCWYPPITGAFRQDPELGGGGSFIDMGNHCVDLLEQLFGHVVEVKCTMASLVQEYPHRKLPEAPVGQAEMQAVAESILGPVCEDTAVAILQFESGAVGVVDALFNVPDAAARNALEVYGSKGSVCSFGTIGQGSGGQLHAVLEKGDKGYDAGQAREEAQEQIIEPPVVNIYQAHIQAFCDAIKYDTPAPIPGEEGIWSHKVIEACYESARTGCAVTVG